MKKFKKIGISFVFLLASLLVVSVCNIDSVQAAATGYHDVAHNFTANDDCGGCSTTVSGVYYTNKSAYTSTKCTACKGNGKGYEFKCSSCSKKYYGTSGSPTACFYCSTTNVSASGTSTKTCATCSGTGKWGKCTHCNGKGVNYKCQNSNCVPKYTTYDNWKTESGYNAVCYTTANTYTVKYNANGGTGTTANSSHTYNTAKALNACGYSRTGYTFLGWSTSSTATTATYTNGQSVKNLTTTNGATVTLYAVWEANTYSVAYDANGGTDAPAKQDFVFGSKDAISSSEPSRTGYTFINWWATHTTSTYFSPGAEIPASWGSFTLQARWSANGYTITLVPNGGTCVNGAGENVDSVTTTFDTMDFNALSYCVPTRTGYTFKGWYDALEGGTKVYDSEGFCTNDGTYWKDNKWVYADNVTLYARWEQNEYTVTYDANGGSTPVTTQTYHYGDEIDLSLETSKNGYKFVGWSDTPDAKTAISTLVMSDLATSDNPDYVGDWEMTLYAVYSIEVSDVANHTYPDYEKKKEKEVYLLVWDVDNNTNYAIYPLDYEYDTNKMVYHYSLNKDISTFADGVGAYYYQIIAYDNAGNHSVIKEGQVKNGMSDDELDVPDPPGEFVTQEYLQTTNHYRYDVVRNSWIKFDTTSEMVEEGTTYQPSCVEPPVGYRTYQISSPKGTVALTNNILTSTSVAYTVSKAETNSVYYMSNAYTLTFNANGGNCDAKTKSINYGDYYGTLPTPSREGWTFTGWYTTSTGGNKVISSDKYLTAGNTTIYAHWTRNTHTVTYDYWTNGGSSVSITGKDVGFGLAVDLTPTAQKSGWTFVGWNTDSDATTPITTYSMPDEDVTLYAIYKKVVTVMVKERMGSSSVDSRNLTATIYNNDTVASFTIAQKNTWSGWTLLGYTTETEADASPYVAVGGKYTTGENVTLYALYSAPVMLTYDTNGSAMTFDVQSKEVYHNTAGGYIYPTFSVLAGPTLYEHSFVNWKVGSGTVTDVADVTVSTCNPSDVVKLKSNATLTARWDAFPEIEAYNRYFTLTQARNGDITEAELLKKVIGTDKEDGTLANGNSVIVKGYSSSMFTSITSDFEVEITYQAMDSYGNIVEKTVTITVTDTTAKKSSTRRYVRFISSRFFKDTDGNILSSSEGGLEETSIWRWNKDFSLLLEATLSGRTKEKETWTIKCEDIKRLRGSL